jgi:hypothetical protein
LISFKASEIERLIPQETSIMPEGPSEAMTIQEFRDLVAYLSKANEEGL